MIFTLRSVADIGEKSDDAGTLDGVGQLTLMCGARTGDSAGQNLCAFGNALSQSVDVLVINSIDLFRAELADLFSLAAVCGTEGLRCRVSLLAGFLDFLRAIQCFSFLSQL